MKRKYDFNEVFHSCVIGSKKRQFTDSENQLNSYLRACHKILPIYINNGLVYECRDEFKQRGYSKAELLHLYNNRLSAKGTTARHYYNKLMEESPDDKCQLCFITDAQSLDHFLHKEDYPSLSISSNNLLPVCIPCNGIKGTYTPKNYESQFLHPKERRIFDRFWLSASFDEIENRIVINPNYSIFKNDRLSIVRVEFHLKRFNLLPAYEALAMRQVGDFLRLSKKLNISLKSVINAELSKLSDRAKEVPIAKYSIDQWSWLTCYALLRSDYFMNNAMNIFDKMPLIKRPNGLFNS